MVLQLVITIIIVSFLRKSFQMPVLMPEWNRRFWWVVYAAIALLAIHFVNHSLDVFTQWLALILLSALIYLVYSNETFKKVSFLVTAVAPYLVVSALIYLIKAISFSTYEDWNEWLDAANTFAVIWGLGTWFITRRQRKELTKAREKAIEEEKNNKVISAMKDQLEVQVAERTMELTKQKEELELALQELKSTQSQLIQSEKMASLGELTAGIAHEIQNPLNFVNNFSEVSNELIDEMKQELANGNGQLANEIADDLKQNLEKINHHGKRAGDIVKGMLQHSRKSSGQKEPTDINALADEYLRLSYHGLRAKDKSFNATMKTDFDETIGKINIIPQDIGRVLLNLFNNAFYAASLPSKGGFKDTLHKHEPFVSVSTKKIGDKVEIKVSDNGPGIQQNIVDKIFQPFFTTKPTGEGTGLGLSLSYDIVKAHGGEIKVETKEAAGTEFIILLSVV